MTVARLKRVLAILNDALTAAARLTDEHLPPARRQHYRAGLLALREEIIALVGRLRGSM